MGEATNIKRRHVEKVSHPYVQIVIAIMAAAGSGGGATAYFQYKSEKLKAEKAAEVSMLEAQYTMADIKAQIAAGVMVQAEQGKQLKRLIEALYKLTMGKRSEARNMTSSIDVPANQGLPILGGRAIKAPEFYEAQRAKIKRQIDVINGID